MNLKDQPVHPTQERTEYASNDPDKFDPIKFIPARDGLTLWQEACLRAMQTMIYVNANENNGDFDKTMIARWACDMADTQIAEMQKRSEGK